MSQFLANLTTDELDNITQNNLFALLRECAATTPETILPDTIAILVDPIVNPNGIWADFTPIWCYWHALKSLVKKKVLRTDQLPPEPDPSDYQNYSSPRSAQWIMPKNGYPVF